MARQKPKRRKKKKKKGGGAGYSNRGSGGVMQSMLGGFRKAAGAEPGKDGKKSKFLSNLLWILLIGAAAAFAFSRYTN